MDILIGIGIGFVCVAVLGVQMMAFPPLWRLGREMRLRNRHRSRAERRRVLLVVVLPNLYLVPVVVLGIAEPWGHYSWVYVLGVCWGAYILLVLIAVTVHLLRWRHRRNHRATLQS